MFLSRLLKAVGKKVNGADTRILYFKKEWHDDIQHEQSVYCFHYVAIVFLCLDTVDFPECDQTAVFFRIHITYVLSFEIGDISIHKPDVLVEIDWLCHKQDCIHKI